MIDPKVTQTILLEDELRPGNCFAAAVATALLIPLHEVPHFVEWGQFLHNGKLKDESDADRHCWWAMFVGFVAARGLWPEEVSGTDDAELGEIVFVAGKSPRGVMHQVLYRNGTLWHDPHPSHDGLLTQTEWFVLRALPAAGHDHEPTRKKDSE